MIDLRNKELPKSLVVNGEAFPIDTDFRTWIRWQDEIAHDNTRAPNFIFTERVPSSPEWVKAAVNFMKNKSATPRPSAKKSPNNARPFDYVLDGDYIVASFWQAYGIDLTSVDYLHWHVFKALFASLPSDSKMAQIMGYRMYDGAKRKQEDVMRELREAWRLPSIDENATIELQQKLFGHLA